MDCRYREVLSSFWQTCRSSTPYTLSTGASAVWVLALLGWLIFTPPNYTNENIPAYSGPCPAITGSRDTDSYFHKDILVDKQIVVPERHISCHKLIEGNTNEINFTQQLNWCYRPLSLSEDDYVEETKNCDNFKNTFGYNLHHITQEEEQFPIAFNILTYENVEQTERLLRAIYRPHNLYCIHVDGKASSSLLNTITNIASCLPNVIVPTNPVIVHWAEFSVLHAELVCLKRLWDHPTKWKYFINLTGREYPLKTNQELVKILQAYNGGNDIDGSRFNRNRDWTDYVWRAENWRTNVHKTPVPHGYNIHKGSAHIVASRAFIDYALHDSKANDLREWMRDTRLPDEHFFNTLNHNPQFNIPGAYKGDPGLKPFYGRLKLWWKSKESKCSGEFSRYICILGTKELKEVTEANHLFVNKLKFELSPVAYQCLEQWYWNKTMHEKPGKKISTKVDLKFYKSLPFSSNHVTL